MLAPETMKAAALRDAGGDPRNNEMRGGSRDFNTATKLKIQYPTDAELLALDFVNEIAATFCSLSAALVAATARADVAATEAALWSMRRALTAAIVSWREAIPAIEIQGDLHQ